MSKLPGPENWIKRGRPLGLESRELSLHPGAQCLPTEHAQRHGSGTVGKIRVLEGYAESPLSARRHLGHEVVLSPGHDPVTGRELARAAAATGTWHVRIGDLLDQGGGPCGQVQAVADGTGRTVPVSTVVVDGERPVGQDATVMLAAEVAVGSPTNVKLSGRGTPPSFQVMLPVALSTRRTVSCGGSRLRSRFRPPRPRSCGMDRARRAAQILLPPLLTGLRDGR